MNQSGSNLLHQVMYFSVRAPHVSDAEVVDGIVLPAMRRNRELNVTGCLWYDSHYFVQTIEGETRALAGLFGSIQRDSRHHSLVTLLDEPIVSRSFARFSMKHVGTRDGVELGDLAEQLLGPRRVPAPKLAAVEFPAVRALIEALTAKALQT